VATRADFQFRKSLVPPQRESLLILFKRNNEFTLLEEEVSKSTNAIDALCLALTLHLAVKFRKSNRHDSSNSRNLKYRFSKAFLPKHGTEAVHLSRNNEIPQPQPRLSCQNSKNKINRGEIRLALWSIKRPRSIFSFSPLLDIETLFQFQEKGPRDFSLGNVVETAAL
jgi:hypothetical protein